MSNRSEAETVHCPKCGEDKIGPYALLGHIYTNHWIVDDEELPEGWFDE